VLLDLRPDEQVSPLQACFFPAREPLQSDSETFRGGGDGEDANGEDGYELEAVFDGHGLQVEEEWDREEPNDGVGGEVVASIEEPEDRGVHAPLWVYAFE